MQFGMHQEVSDCVIAFSGTKAIALKNNCIPKTTLKNCKQYYLAKKQSKATLSSWTSCIKSKYKW